VTAAECAPFIAALVFYAASVPLYLGRWPVRGSRAARWGTCCVVLGLLCHLAAIVMRGAIKGDWPIMEMRETLLLAGFVLPAFYLAARTRTSAGLGVLAMLVAMAAVILALVIPPRPLGEALTNASLLRVHIAIAIAGYAAFALSFCCACAYIIQESLLKRKKLVGFSQHLPSLDSAELMGYKLAALGFLLWTAMIAMGIIYSAKVHGEMWSWAPKGNWSMLTWATYAAYLHLRTLGNYRGRRTMLLLILGFACAGATWLLPGQIGDRFHL